MPKDCCQPDMYIPMTIGYRHGMMAINSTRDFHLKSSVDLMKEYTINESLSEIDSPYMKCLSEAKPFGEIVAERLNSEGLIKHGAVILEAGGGYGTLMGGMLSFCGHMVRKVVMADLSQRLLLKQKRHLGKWRAKCSFINADIHQLFGFVKGIDLIIMNEVIGDLDTITGLNARSLSGESLLLINKYGLDIPETGEFSLNSGAIKALESICQKGIPAFISEHSCDPIIPDDMSWLSKGLELNSYPREIRLSGHSEYTIRFAHLIKVAQNYGRKTLTGSYMELVGMKRLPSYRFIFEARACSTPEQEIILEFLEHIREYRWLIVI